jgi:hypothetical protein
MWIALAALTCQPGFVSVALAFTHSVTPACFLALQLVLVAITIMVPRSHTPVCREAAAKARIGGAGLNRQEESRG